MVRARSRIDATRRSKGDAADTADLDRAIGRQAAPDVAATARVALTKLRARFPGARLLVYERRKSFPIGIAPQGRGPIFSVVLFPRWVRFFFLEGVVLDDPEGRLEGNGSMVRSIRLDADAAILDDPYVCDLMMQAQREAGVDLRTGNAEVVFKSRIGQPSVRR